MKDKGRLGYLVKELLAFNAVPEDWAQDPTIMDNIAYVAGYKDVARTRELLRALVKAQVSQVPATPDLPRGFLTRLLRPSVPLIPENDQDDAMSEPGDVSSDDDAELSDQTDSADENSPGLPKGRMNDKTKRESDESHSKDSALPLPMLER
jgi:hypothetical protein